MEKLQDCRRMIERTRWIDARLMGLRSGTERTTSVLRKTPRVTAETSFLEGQLDKITEFERYYSAQLIEQCRWSLSWMDGSAASAAARGCHAAAVYRCSFME